MDSPAANNVKHFPRPGFSLISVRAVSLEAPARLEDEGQIVVGIERGKRFFIPCADETVEPGDLVYFFGKSEPLGRLSQKLDTQAPRHIGRCVIFGAHQLRAGNGGAQILRRPGDRFCAHRS